MNTQQFAKLFPLGSHLCREPMPPMAEMKRDMELLKRNGFNLIKLQENWMLDEPAEQSIHLEKYDELIAHAATLDLGVYLGLTCEQAPAWLWRKHPECRMIGRNGLPVVYEAQTTMPCDGKPGPCFDHPGARADMVRFITRLVQTLGRHENIVVWNTWQEVGYWAEYLVGQHVCYCRHTLEFYQSWLRSLFAQDLDLLNKAWNSRYATWHDVVPDRSHIELAYAQEVYWRYFMDNVQIGRVLTTRAEAIRAADPMHRPVFAHKGAPQIGGGQDWTYARCQDFLGSSAYPAWGCAHDWDDLYGKQPYPHHEALLGETWGKINLPFDFLRGANKPGAPLWAAEFQGGPVCTGFHNGRTITPEDIRHWMLNVISTGATAISFWVSRAEIMAMEMNGFSLLDSTGDTTARLQEAGRIGRALNRHADLFGQATLAPAKVAILANEWNFQASSVIGIAKQHAMYSTRGWHRILWESGIPVDFLSIDDVAERSGGYAALILPFPLTISDKYATALSDYVKAGGNLISEACPGRISENLYSNRGELSPVLAHLFGVNQTSLTMVREPNPSFRWLPRERTWNEYLESSLLTGTGPLAGHRLRANLYVETFEAGAATAILKSGKMIAGTCRTHGTGRAWLLGTFAGHNGTAYRDAASWRCILKILAICDIHPETTGPVVRRRRIAENREAWIYVNTGKKQATATIPAMGWKLIEDLLDQPLRHAGRSIKFSIKPLDVRVIILTRK